MASVQVLKKIGSTNGDKHLQGNIPNLQCREFRYYPQDNPNLIQTKRRRVARKAFLREC